VAAAFGKLEGSAVAELLPIPQTVLGGVDVEILDFVCEITGYMSAAGLTTQTLARDGSGYLRSLSVENGTFNLLRVSQPEKSRRVSPSPSLVDWKGVRCSATSNGVCNKRLR
jgi:hypothetical protein